MPCNKAKLMVLYYYRQLKRMNTPTGKTVAVGQTKLPLSWTSVNNKLMLQYLRFSTRWMSIQLATELKERNVDICHGFLQQ